MSDWIVAADFGPRLALHGPPKAHHVAVDHRVQTEVDVATEGHRVAPDRDPSPPRCPP